MEELILEIVQRRYALCKKVTEMAMRICIIDLKIWGL